MTTTESGIHLHEVTGKSMERMEVPTFQADENLNAVEVGMARKPKSFLDSVPMLAAIVFIAIFYNFTFRLPDWREHSFHKVSPPHYFSSLLRAPPLPSNSLSAPF